MKRILFAALTAAALFSGGILQSLNAQNMEIPKKVSPFPVGDKLPEQFSKYFVGQAWLAPLTDDKRLNAPVSNVTFSPGCRNNWHSHTGGQLLIAVGGRGYYQEKGRPARALLPGDIVEIAPDVVHWHGAAPDSWFSHLAVACNPATNENTWLEPVDDAQYAAATASVPAPRRSSPPSTTSASISTQPLPPCCATSPASTRRRPRTSSPTATSMASSRAGASS